MVADLTPDADSIQLLAFIQVRKCTARAVVEFVCSLITL